MFASDFWADGQMMGEVNRVLAAVFLSYQRWSSKLRSPQRTLSGIVKRIPFTLVMVTGLVVVGVLAGSHVELLDRATRRYFGGSLQTILTGELTRLFTSLFLTAGGGRFFASVLMLSVCVGWPD